ncbi:MULTISPECIES: CHASE2 domain-containing protein [Prochlorococcus]|uniref:Guanylate cyclase domain-containing protein n=1 Tax=Prochlorococcus marinus (strain MIT 9303) TaxID=59922 RepID=A2C6I2_PROM3|nr:MULTISPECIES: adenylate/guanylate cyclase domain-containing protein [Prochlorococcus]ABM77092.1 Hypothetical protein P9303_03401 [Prochlorococcus marinus str. MIT 9303]KZR65978.1 Adenylate cyclase 1 [Prochlorococcus sp. MIT 1306]
MKLSQRIRDGLVQAGLIGAAALFLGGLSTTGISASIDWLLYDSVITLRSRDSAQRHPVTIVGIDEDDISHYGWPIDDAVLCRALRNALQANASAIGLDLYRDQGIGPQQSCLPELIRQNSEIVAIFNAAEGITAPPGTPAAQQAFNDLVVDADGVIRRDLIHVSGQDAATVSLPVRLIETSGLQPGLLDLLKKPDRAEQLGPWLLPHSGGYRDLDAAGYQRLLPFHQPGSFRTISLRTLADGKWAAEALQQGDIVLLGSTAPSLKDLFEIPHSRFSQSNKFLMPGVEVHALRVAALLNGLDQPWTLRTLPPWNEQGLELIAILVGISLGASCSKLQRSITITTVLTVVLAGCGAALLWTQGLWIGLTLPVISLPVMAGVGWLRRGALLQRQKQQIERLLGQTTSPAVAQQLWEQRDSLLRDGQFEGKQVTATVLFTDTQDFTSISEQLSPSELLTWLNRGMSLLVQEITNHGGIINKFTGDGLLAVFGAPISQGMAVDAGHAIDASLAITARLAELNQALKLEQAPAMRMRIGIHSGPVIAGSMGSSARLEFTVMGDTVNCASRLESLARVPADDSCRTLFSQETLMRCERDDLLWHSVGRLQVKGRQQELDVLELKGTKPAANVRTGSAPADDRARSADQELPG